MEQTRTQKFIKDNARLMLASQEFFNEDSVLMTMDDYNKADLRILVVFPSPASTKAVSMTAGVLNDYVQTSCPGVFIDFAYAPEQSDIKFYDKANVPYVIGNITHLDASHYDIVGFSISILYESIVAGWLINSFSRCDKPVPFSWTERKDMKLSDVPVIYAGGITCSVADIAFGELGDGRQAYIDFLHLGEFHCAKLLFDHYIKCKKEGETVQGMIDRFWNEVEFNNWLYQPQAYEVKFNDKNQIISNIKINPNAPDMCQPYYPDVMPKEIGSARGIVMGNGVNAGLGQILAANGCSRSGFCNFSVSGDTLIGTEKGLETINALAGEEGLKLQSTGLVDSKAIHYQRIEPIYRVVLESGSFLDCSENHKWIRAIDAKSRKHKRYTTKAIGKAINAGQEFVVLRKIGNHFGLEWSCCPTIVNIKENSIFVDEQFYRYNTGLNSEENMVRVNQLLVTLNFYGYDTVRSTDENGNAVIDWWPVNNSVVQDKVVAVVDTGVEGPTYDVENTTDHTVCYNMIVTSNCHEGAYTGGWVENSHDRLMYLAKQCRKYTASTTLKAYSFNSNYLSDYKGNIYGWLGIYPRVTFNNMRLEELGLDKDALKMMKLAGYQRMTAPLEGVSERIRNNLLNKNLSEEALENYLNYGMMMGAVDCKVGIVLTGYEEEEDWQYMWDFNMKWRKKCQEMGGNIPFRYKCCLTEDALTPVPGVGLVSQRELLDEFELEGYTRANIVDKAPQGLSKVLKLTTKEGFTITGTPNHPVLINPKDGLSDDSFKMLSELNPGDKLYVRVGTRAFGQYFLSIPLNEELLRKCRGQKGLSDFILTPALAEILGWYVGDGYTSDGRRLGLCYSKKEYDVLQRHKSILEEYQYKVNFEECAREYKLTVNNIALVDLVNREFGHTHSGKKISEYILKSPEDVQCAFLRGLFSSDGTIGNYDNGRGCIRQWIRLGMNNEKVVSTVQIMLSNLGIFSKQDKPRKNGNGLIYNLRVASHHRGLFNDLIGFVGYKSRVEVNSSYRNMTGRWGDFHAITVSSVQEVEDAETFGFRTSNVTYVTNGIVSHNTIMVHYPHTPIEYIERRAPRASFYGTYLMPNEWNDKFYENHVRIKLNGFKHSTFIEQAIVDLGRYATPWLYKYIIKPNYPFYNLRTIVNHEDAWEAFKAMINPDYFFNERKMDEYISICHRIHIAMHANVIYQAKKILEKGVNATPTTRCLKTYEGCPVVCKAFVYKDNPLITYGDVHIGEDGKLTGTIWEEVKGCQRCKTAEDRKAVMQRELPMSKTADDILMYKAPSIKQRLRFRIRRNKDYEVLNPRNTAFVSFSKFLRASDELCQIFWELDSYHNLFWQSEEDKTYVVSGSQIYDVTFTDRKALEIVTSMIPEINKNAKSFQVLGVREVPLDEKIKVTDLNIFKFESTLSAELWQYAVMNYHGEVKVEASMGGMETITDQRLKAPQFKLRDKVVGYFAIPAKYSPWHYLQGLFSVRKTPLSKLLNTTTITSVTTVRPTNVACMCGKEESVRDIYTGKTQPVGVECMMALLTQKL